MSLITVDEDKCARDGICVEVCPVSVLELDSEGLPQVRPGGEQHCMSCGHCVAACPYEALENVKSPLSSQLPIPPGFSLDPETAAIYLRSRRSVRRYREEPIARDQMLKLLDIARFAPSGHNTQGISYLVVEGREHLDGVRKVVLDWMGEVLRVQPEFGKRYNFPAVIRAHEKGKDRLLRGAPHIIVAHAPKSLVPAPVSTFLALEYVELYAPALGMGTCWAGYVQRCAAHSPALTRSLGISEDRAITGILMVGYPKYSYHRLPDRNPLDAAWFGG